MDLDQTIEEEKKKEERRESGSVFEILLLLLYHFYFSFNSIKRDGSDYTIYYRYQSVINKSSFF